MTLTPETPHEAMNSTHSALALRFDAGFQLGNYQNRFGENFQQLVRWVK